MFELLRASDFSQNVVLNKPYKKNNKKKKIINSFDEISVIKKNVHIDTLIQPITSWILLMLQTSFITLVVIG